MTMTLNNSAISLGTAFGGYPVLGLVAPIFPLVGAGVVWWSGPRAARPVLAAE